MCDVCLHSSHLRGCPLEQRDHECLCEQCGEPIYSDEERWVDEDRNRFCSEQCAEEFHKIHREEG